MNKGMVGIIVFVALAVGFGTGFVLRPIIIPPGQTTLAIKPSHAPVAPRGTQYFAAHLDEARRIVTGCRDGSVRGDECANAEQAVVEVEGRDRFKHFTGN